jgi:hypothetical protein
MCSQTLGNMMRIARTAKDVFCMPCHDVLTTQRRIVKMGIVAIEELLLGGSPTLTVSTNHPSGREVVHGGEGEGKNREGSGWVQDYLEYMRKRYGDSW